MAIKAADLLARIKQTEEDARALRAYWESSLPVAPPPDFELKTLVRKFPLEDLATGIEAYAAKLTKKPDAPATTENALRYVAGTAWTIEERDNPQERFQTERRKRNAKLDPDSPDWDSEAYGTGTGENRQKTIARVVATQKAKREQ
jgi:hypothetical protein